MSDTTPIHRAPESPATRQTLSLAGVFQAASLVDELARTGQTDPRAFDTLIKATLELNPPSFESIYGGHPNNLRRGLDTLEALAGRKQANPVVLRHGFTLLLLMNKLRTDAPMMEDLGQRLHRVQGQAEHFGSTHENVIASLGEVYQQTLSTMKTRIMVQGDPSILQRHMMAERVRSCLLGGVRFALLWHQQGGRRWRLVLQRRAMRHALDQLG